MRGNAYSAFIAIYRIEMGSLSEYEYADARPTEHHSYLLPRIARLLGTPKRVFDLGCGNGSIAAALHELGHTVTGIDGSASGIAQARAAYPHLALHQASAYDDLAARFGQFPLVLSLEVVEHLFDPRRFAEVVFDLLEPGGTAVISTPYHGYIKNLALALTGRMDAHFTALWDFGHIKFWSIKTLSALLEEAGFEDLRFERVGRIPSLAKSMIVCCRRPVG